MLMLTEEAIPRTLQFPTLPGTSPGIVPFPDIAPEPLRFDRRRLPRKQMAGFAMAVFSTGFAATTVARVELVDASHTGLCVKSPTPIEEGATFSIIPEDPLMPRRVGITVRCKDADGGFHLGLRMRRDSAAA